MTTQNATIYTINFNNDTIQDTCLAFEGREVIFIEWFTDRFIICVTDL